MTLELAVLGLTSEFLRLCATSLKFSNDVHTLIFGSPHLLQMAILRLSSVLASSYFYFDVALIFSFLFQIFFFLFFVFLGCLGVYFKQMYNNKNQQ